jgi:hypothetical protein
MCLCNKTRAGSLRAVKELSVTDRTSSPRLLQFSRCTQEQWPRHPAAPDFPPKFPDAVAPSRATVPPWSAELSRWSAEVSQLSAEVSRWSAKVSRQSAEVGAVVT